MARATFLNVYSESRASFLGPLDAVSGLSFNFFGAIFVVICLGLCLIVGDGECEGDEDEEEEVEEDDVVGNEAACTYKQRNTYKK